MYYSPYVLNVSASAEFSDLQAALDAAKLLELALRTSPTFSHIKPEAHTNAISVIRNSDGRDLFNVGERPTHITLGVQELPGKIRHLTSELEKVYPDLDIDKALENVPTLNKITENKDEWVLDYKTLISNLIQITGEPKKEVRERVLPAIGAALVADYGI
jgi:hypothetical protein